MVSICTTAVSALASVPGNTTECRALFGDPDFVSPESVLPARLLGIKTHFKPEDRAAQLAAPLENTMNKTAKWSQALASRVNAHTVFRIMTVTPEGLRQVLRDGIVPSASLFERNSSRQIFDRVFTAVQPTSSVWSAMYTGFYFYPADVKQYIILLEIEKNHPGVVWDDSVERAHGRLNLVANRIYADQIRRVYFADPDAANRDFPFLGYDASKLRHDLQITPTAVDSSHLAAAELRPKKKAWSEPQPRTLSFENPDGLSTHYFVPASLLRPESNIGVAGVEAMTRAVISDSLFLERPREQQSILWDQATEVELEIPSLLATFNQLFPTQLTQSSNKIKAIRQLTLYDETLLIRRQSAVQELALETQIIAGFGDLVEKLKKFGASHHTVPVEPYDKIVNAIALKFFGKPNEYYAFSGHANDDFLGLSLLAKSDLAQVDLADELYVWSARLAQSESQYLRDIAFIIQQSLFDLRASHGKNDAYFVTANFLRIWSSLQDFDLLSALSAPARRDPAAYHFARIAVAGAAEISISDGHHPQIFLNAGANGSVPNSFSGGARSAKVFLLKGPNKAGKSTFLKQLAQNSLLTMLGAPAPLGAASRLTPLRIFSAMSHENAVGDSESGFSSNAKLILRTIENARRTRRSLVIIDEPFIGTTPNLADILLENLIRQLAQESFISIVVTHSETVQQRVAGTEGVGLLHNTSDFRIHSGASVKSYSAHAISVLEQLGYRQALPGFIETVERALDSPPP